MSGVEFPVRAVIDDKAIKLIAAELNKAGKAAGMTEKEIKEMNDQIRVTGTEGVRHVGNVNKGLNNLVTDGLKKVGAAFLAAFALDRLISVGKEIISITAEFQKFEAVLTNALGSQSAAQIGMQMLQKFAAKTPFSVQELTASYVKLVNQGFIPTENELRKLGDLSSSTGKGFDQLTEAILDAQTGEFERLKEFGIKASKEGDKITFTFKGVKTQVDSTSESIQKYILSLGDATGVSGSMAAISATLGGSISNMGDAWDHFLETLGDGEKGPLQNAVRNLTALLEIATEWVKTDEQLFDDQKVAAQGTALDNFKKMAAAYTDINEAAKAYITIIDSQIAVDLKKSNSLDLSHAEERNALEDTIQILRAQKTAVEDYVKANQKGTEADKEKVKWIENILNLQGKLKDLQQDQLVQTGEQLAATNREIEATEERIKVLRELGLVIEKFHELKVPQSALDYFKQLKEANSGANKTKGFTDALWDRPAPEIKGVDVKAPNATDPMKSFTANEDLKRQILQESFDLESSLINELQNQQQQRYQDDIAALEAKRDYELSLVEGNAVAQDRINKEFDQRQRQMKAKQAEADKRQALFNILNSTAQGVMSALATSNVPLSIYVAAQGLLQAGFVAARDVPKFSKGGRVKGKGTETSDSILARLSVNETVISAQSSHKFGDVLDHIIEHPNATHQDLKKLIDARIPSQLRGDLWKSGQQRDSLTSKQLDEVNKNLKELLNKTETHFSFDEHGFGVHLRKGNYWETYMSNRYSM